MLADFLQLQTGWIWLINPLNGQFYTATARALPPFLRRSVEMTGQSCRCMIDFLQGRLEVRNIRLVECSRLERAVRDHAASSAQTLGLRWHASIPLQLGDRRLGIINVAGPKWRRLRKTELALLSSAADLISIAVEREGVAEERSALARAGERQRLSRELHDTLAQGLTAISLQLESALNVLETDTERARGRIESALSSTRASLDELRGNLIDLREEVDPLVVRLRGLARQVATDTGIRVQVHASAALRLPLPVERELYGIAREALNNVCRHADASQVDIHLDSDGLIVRDDGRGFDVRTAAQGRLGLRGMRERARLIGGVLELHSGPGAGTELRVMRQIANGPEASAGGT